MERSVFWKILTFFTLVSLLLTGCSKASPTPTPIPTPTASQTALPPERTVKVTALAFYTKSDGTAGGTTNTVTVRVRRKEDTGLKVGIFNSEVEGTGPMWRASAWSAVALACLILGVNPEHFEFSFDAGGGRIDGPSAGALTTVATMAALLGDEVRDDAAMTGTINPDGTIGPVGGIPQKIEGAHKAGKKLVLIPAGQRYDYDENLKKKIDVVDKGKRLGMEIREVGDVFQAYQILTGKPLPYPKREGTIEEPPRAFAKLRSYTTELLARYDKAVDTLNSLPEDIRQDRFPTYGAEQAKLAKEALEQGMGALAVQRAWEAAGDAEGSLQAALLDQAYDEKGLTGVIDVLKASMSSRQEFESVLQKLQAENPRSSTEVIALMDAWSDLANAYGYKERGDELVQMAVQGMQKKQINEDQLLDLLYEASDDYVEASTYLDFARKSADLGLGFGTAPVPDKHRLKVMADLLRHAADANLTLFESVMVAPLANKLGISTERAKQRLMAINPDYAGAVYARNGAMDLWDKVWEEPAHSEMIFGYSLTAWAEAAYLIDEFYSLGAEHDKEGNIVRIRYEKALINSLDLAEERSKETIGLVSKEDPVTAIYYAEVGHAWRQGDPNTQLISLFYQWQAALDAQTQAYFTGYYGQAVKEELEKTGRPTSLLEFWDLPK